MMARNIGRYGERPGIGMLQATLVLCAVQLECHPWLARARVRVNEANLTHRILTTMTTVMHKLMTIIPPPHKRDAVPRRSAYEAPKARIMDMRPNTVCHASL